MSQQWPDSVLCLKHVSPDLWCCVTAGDFTTVVDSQKAAWGAGCWLLSVWRGTVLAGGLGLNLESLLVIGRIGKKWCSCRRLDGYADVCWGSECWGSDYRTVGFIKCCKLYYH